MSRSIIYAVAIAVLAGSGCAGSQASKRDDAVLRTQVAELKAERRRAKREIRDLERQLVKKQEKQPASKLPVEVRGPEPVVDVEPGVLDVPSETDGEVAYVTEDGVEVLYVGEAAKQESMRPTLTLHETRSRPKLQPPPARARKPVAPVPRPKERIAPLEGKVPKISAAGKKAPAPAAKDPRTEYKKHYAALRDGDHDAAISGFRGFVKRYPKHEYADNAQYWLGESYYDRRDYKTALAEFRKVVEKFPKGNKAGDAMLKSAYCYEHLGHVAKARDVLEHIGKTYPKSNAAVLAADRLVNLESD